MLAFTGNMNKGIEILTVGCHVACSSPIMAEALSTMSLYVGNEACIVSHPLYAATLLACTCRRNDNVLVANSPGLEAIRRCPSPNILILQDRVSPKPVKITESGLLNPIYCITTTVQAKRRFELSECRRTRSRGVGSPRWLQITKS